MATTISFELDIPGIEIIKTTIDKNGKFHIEAKSTATECKCNQCEKKITKIHSYGDEISIRHLPILGDKECYIHIKPRRFWCEDCKKSPTEQYEWKGHKIQHTYDYEPYILKQLINSTAADVARKENIDEGVIDRILKKYYQKEVNWNDFEKLGQIGIDEIALKKGHKDFVTIVTSRINGEIKILGVLKDKKKKTVKEFLQKIPKLLKKTVTSVCSDLYEGFINAAAEVFGKKIKIVADRFHVAKLYRGSFDKLRLKELGRLRKNLSKEKYAELKNAMWILRKKSSKLNCKEKKVLKKLFEQSPDLKKAYEMRNNLTEIFDTQTSRNGGIRRLKNWIKKVTQSTLTCFKTFVGTLTKRMIEIANYFIKRENSGFVEGFNNKIKVLKRRCYGIKSEEYLFQRMSLDIDKSYFSSMSKQK